MKKRTNKSKEEFAKIIHKYFTECKDMTRQEFCNKEDISATAFYRNLKLYKSNQENRVSKVKTKESEVNFTELKPAKIKSKQNIWIKLFGIKLFSLELEYV